MRRAAITENDGLQQGRPARLVDMVDIDSRFQQRTHGLDVAVVRGRDQGGTAVAIDAGEVGAGLQRHAQYLQAPLGARVKIRRVADIVLRIDVGTCLDQRARGIDGIAPGRQQQRAAAGVVARFDIGAGGEQFSDALGVVGRRRGKQFLRQV